MNESELKLIRDYIVENIVRNSDVFIKCLDIDVDEHLDVIDIIVGLYDMLHKEVTGENYDICGIGQIKSDSGVKMTDSIKKS